MVQRTISLLVFCYVVQMVRFIEKNEVDLEVFCFSHLVKKLRRLTPVISWRRQGNFSMTTKLKFSHWLALRKVKKISSCQTCWGRWTLTLRPSPRWHHHSVIRKESSNWSKHSAVLRSFLNFSINKPILTSHLLMVLFRKSKITSPGKSKENQQKYKIKK